MWICLSSNIYILFIIIFSNLFLANNSNADPNTKLFVMNNLFCFICIKLENKENNSDLLYSIKGVLLSPFMKPLFGFCTTPQKPNKGLIIHA